MTEWLASRRQAVNLLFRSLIFLTYSRNFPTFVRPTELLHFLELPLTDPLAESNKPSPKPLISFYVRSFLILTSHLLLVTPSFLFPSAFSAAIFFFTLATCFPRLCFFQFAIRIAFSEDHKLRASALQQFLLPTIASCFLDRRNNGE